MANTPINPPAPNDFRPIILVRGFDTFAQSADSTYYGFNDGSVYPEKFGDDYIYEGMLLSFLKTRFVRRSDMAATAAKSRTIGTPYFDATNVLRFYPYRPFDGAEELSVSKREKREREREREEIGRLDKRGVAALSEFLLDGKEPTEEQKRWLVGPLVLDPRVAARFAKPEPVPNTVWVYRFYDFGYRDIRLYARELEKMVEIVSFVTGVQGINLVCHSMGGLIARYLIQERYGNRETAERHVNKWVTMATPHRGITFSPGEALTLAELEYFARNRLEKDLGGDFARIAPYFDPDRVLCIVGTNHQAYAGLVGRATSGLNQLAALARGRDENRSDGLVAQESATLVAAHRADVFKPHSGPDSIITARESFELATRFFFGDVSCRIRVREAEIRKNYEDPNARRLLGLPKIFEGAPEFYIGFSVKPRKLDFFLHRQDADSENCFGPFHDYKITGSKFRWDPEDRSRDGLVFEGFFNSALALRHSSTLERENLVFRWDTYVAERDRFGLRHSDSEIVREQSYFEVEPLSDENGVLPDPPLRLNFHPKIGQHGDQRVEGALTSLPLACVYQGDNTYLLDVPFGALDPDFRIVLAITIEGPWNQPAAVPPQPAPQPEPVLAE